jgi:hypothetical protein
MTRTIQKTAKKESAWIYLLNVRYYAQVALARAMYPRLVFSTLPTKRISFFKKCHLKQIERQAERDRREGEEEE